MLSMQQLRAQVEELSPVLCGHRKSRYGPAYTLGSMKFYEKRTGQPTVLG
jgi:hypothetical protein